MFAEITDNTGVADTHVAWVLYDSDCRRCTRTVQRWRRLLRAHGLTPASLHLPWVRAVLQRDGLAHLEAMRCLTVDGRITSGARALEFIFRQIWWTRPLAWAWCVPGMAACLDRAYARVALHRHCRAGQGHADGRSVNHASD